MNNMNKKLKINFSWCWLCCTSIAGHVGCYPGQLTGHSAKTTKIFIIILIQNKTKYFRLFLFSKVRSENWEKSWARPEREQSESWDLRLNWDRTEIERSFMHLHQEKSHDNMDENFKLSVFMVTTGFHVKLPRLWSSDKGQEKSSIWNLSSTIHLSSKLQEMSREGCKWPEAINIFITLVFFFMTLAHHCKIQSKLHSWLGQQSKYVENIVQVIFAK